MEDTKGAIINLTSSDFHFASDPVMHIHREPCLLQGLVLRLFDVPSSHTHIYTFALLLSVTSGSLCCSCHSLFCSVDPQPVVGLALLSGTICFPSSQSHTQTHSRKHI